MPWVGVAFVQPAVVIGYLCAPRAIFNAFADGPELPLDAGVLDRKLAYGAVLLLAYRLVALRWPDLGSRLVRVWLHVEFALGLIEAGSLYSLGIGFSPLFFHHAGWEAVGMALRQHWWPVVAGGASMAGVDVLLRRTVSPQLAFAAGARWAIVLVMAFGVRSAVRLSVDAVPQEFPSAGLTANWIRYARGREAAARLTLVDSEREVLRNLGVGSSTLREPTSIPSKPWNLITIFLEGGQADFSRAWSPGRSELMPNLDRFAARAVRFANFYNAVTPTINALISSHCGVIAEIENDRLGLDRGYTRNLRCLSDWLHQAGYYQMFLGGADAAFSGKNLFLFAHHFDEVWGWDDWRTSARQRNDWGLSDTDLARQAVARLPMLRERSPFHLSLLTVNAHPPGFVAADCPTGGRPSSLPLAVRCTDQAIGRLLQALDRHGYFEDSVIAIVGDHTVLPSPDNRQALQGETVGWFGRMYLAVSYPGSAPRVVRTTGYTPDFAPIVLDALKFDPVPTFPFGRSTLRQDQAARTVVARHFQILDGEMHPREPDLLDRCDPEQLTSTVIDVSDRQPLSVCERHKLVRVVEDAAETNSCLLCQQ